MKSGSEKLITRAELAKRYSVSLRTVSNWIARRKLPVVRLSPKILRFDVETCDKIIAEKFTIEARSLN